MEIIVRPTAEEVGVSAAEIIEPFVRSGATLGLALGVVLALGIQALFATFGLDLSGTGLVFTPRTVIAAYAVGIVVTMLAAWVPARRAGSVPPVAAMRASPEPAIATSRSAVRPP